MVSKRRSNIGIAAIWIAFVAVHLIVSFGALRGPNSPLKDVSTVYHDWIAQGLHGGGWVGLTTVWVYPTLALAPMLLAAVAGLANYAHVWLVLVALLDAGALAVLTRGGTVNRRLGWWWLAFQLVLGPIAVGRIDSITVPLALVGVTLIARRPVVASVLLSAAAWMKVWPAALVLAAVVATKQRIPVLVTALVTTVAVVLVVLLAGGGLHTVIGFVAQQTGRGLQLEAPVTTWWLWSELVGGSGTLTSFDPRLLTYQVTGPGTAIAAAVMTPLMGVVVVALVVVSMAALRRGAASESVLAVLALALTTTFIVTNKVGSPQYETWLAVPIVLGLLLAETTGRSFVAPAALALVVAGLTQVIYPWFYSSLVRAAPLLVGVATVRNLLLLAVLAWCIRELLAILRAGAVPARIAACS